MKFHPVNERIKHRYFGYLRDAKRLDEQSIDTTARAINRFEEFADFRDFIQFRSDHASAFKAHLLQETSAKGTPLSKATIVSTLNTLKRFFSWLPGQAGYKSRLRYEWSDYFNPSFKDITIACTHRESRVPTPEQVARAIDAMPTLTPIQCRDGAVVALIALTGARDDAVASLRLKHIDIAEGMIFQDGRDVRTKFAKTISTWFFPVDERYVKIVSNWVEYLRGDLGFDPDDPFFPKTIT
ncbi:tyrosine-type recombinase/integrase [Devosia sp.]|uniref:tyrosine-type recombinase/integrase n=1 Tax=Devosia sp. TaxID=1871048 RepID=UPI003BAD97DC